VTKNAPFQAFSESYLVQQAGIGMKLDSFQAEEEGMEVSSAAPSPGS
jgi:hypothetical protein